MTATPRQARDTGFRYRWAGIGDLNAFFGLMLDNVTNLVFLAQILILVFQFPPDIVYGKIIKTNKRTSARFFRLL